MINNGCYNDCYMLYNGGIFKIRNKWGIRNVNVNFHYGSEFRYDFYNDLAIIWLRVIVVICRIMVLVVFFFKFYDDLAII